MTDRAAPKAKKTKAANDTAKVKKTGPKLVVADLKGIGHNSNGEVIPGLVKIVDEILHLDAQKAAIGKAQRDLRNRAKSEFGVLSGPLAYELRLRKMDTDVREQFESAHKDLKVALGYQTEMEFLKSGEKAQIPAKEHAHQPGYSVEHGEDDGADAPQSQAAGGIISREG